MKYSIESILYRIGQIAGDEGDEVFAVGGYVRDSILGRETREIDQQMLEMLKDLHNQTKA